MARECWSCCNFPRMDRAGVVCSQVSNVWHLCRHVRACRCHLSSIFDHTCLIRHRFWLGILHHIASALGKCENHVRKKARVKASQRGNKMC